MNSYEEEILDYKGNKMPFTIPMEALCFIYPNLNLGGFPSSLYMSAPLNYLYDDLFSDAEFYY